jgi:hypothetical protein
VRGLKLAYSRYAESLTLPLSLWKGRGDPCAVGAFNGGEITLRNVNNTRTSSIFAIRDLASHDE